MYSELEILVKAVGKGCLVVEKSTYMVWEVSELDAARAANLFQQPDRLLAPDGNTAITPPFPCSPHGAGPAYRVIGQTSHFVIFGREQLPVSE